ncbi:MAG: succinate dehydrogenase, cytochrome b556 subunit [Desulfobacterales bacterium]|nr:MAG: succinate dehydrogenase, cytochrome b556 subunit [Desulfobacterales bacterium]
MNEAPQYPKRPGVINRFFRRTLWGEKMNLGAYMWGLQRVTGLILLVYLLLHLYILSSIFGGARTFDQTVAAVDHPLIKLLELGLLGTVVFHALNGLRLILMTLFVELDQKILAYGLGCATLIFVVVSIPFVW